MNELDKKIHILERFRIQYYQYYEPIAENESVSKACLVENSPDFFEITKIVVSWVLSGLSWDVLKNILKKFKERRKKVDSDIENILNDEAILEKFVISVRTALLPLESIDPKIRSLLIEELAIDIIVTHGLDSKNKKLSMLMSESVRRAQEKLNISFSDEERSDLVHFLENHYR